MASLTEAVQSAIRAVTGTSGMYNEDWHAYFTLNSIPIGTWNERIIAMANTLDASIRTASSAHNLFLYDPALIVGGSSPIGDSGSPIALTALTGLVY